MIGSIATQNHVDISIKTKLIEIPYQWSISTPYLTFAKDKGVARQKHRFLY